MSQTQTMNLTAVTSRIAAWRKDLQKMKSLTLSISIQQRELVDKPQHRRKRGKESIVKKIYSSSRLMIRQASCRRPSKQTSRRRSILTGLIR